MTTSAHEEALAYPGDLAACRAEVNRLRANVEQLQRDYDAYRAVMTDAVDKFEAAAARLQRENERLRLLHRADQERAMADQTQKDALQDALRRSAAIEAASARLKRELDAEILRGLGHTTGDTEKEER